jgi:hypothetical protein
MILDGTRLLRTHCVPGDYESAPPGAPLPPPRTHLGRICECPPWFFPNERTLRCLHSAHHPVVRTRDRSGRVHLPQRPARGLPHLYRGLGVVGQVLDLANLRYGVSPGAHGLGCDITSLGVLLHSFRRFDGSYGTAFAIAFARVGAALLGHGPQPRLCAASRSARQDGRAAVQGQTRPRDPASSPTNRVSEDRSTDRLSTHRHASPY